MGSVFVIECGAVMRLATKSFDLVPVKLFQRMDFEEGGAMAALSKQSEGGLISIASPDSVMQSSCGPLFFAFVCKYHWNHSSRDGSHLPTELAFQPRCCEDGMNPL